MINLCLETYSKLYVAISGGVDSLVLLHILAQNHKVSAIHINHGLQANALDAEAACEKICNELSVPLKIIKLDDLDSISKNMENEYRNARYSAILANVEANSTIALAHHKDDQLETRIKRIFTASNFISGIKQSSQFRSLKLIRPLLEISKEEIVSYARKYELHWVEDPSNRDLRFERNVIRHNIIPIIKSTWPGVHKSLATLAEKQQLKNQLTEEIAIQDLSFIANKNTINLAQLANLSDTRQLNAWLKWLVINNIKLDFRNCKNLLWQCKTSTKPIKLNDKKSWIRYNYHGLIIDNIVTSEVKIWPDLNQKLNISIGSLNIDKGNLRRPKVNEIVYINYRAPGQAIRLHGKQHRQKLKKLMQEAKIPRHLRQRWPMIYYNEQLAFIPMIGVCHSFYCKNGINIYLEGKELELLVH